MTYTHKMVDGIEVALSPDEIAELEARDLEWAAEMAAIEAQRPINDAKEELAELDKKVPRGLEDTINALNATASLPQYTLDIIARKNHLRTIIRG